jgi:erythromycin esterase-like protein
MDFALVLSRRYGDKLWTLNGDDYDGLIWQDKGNPPTRQELEKQYPQVIAEIAAEAAAKEAAKASALAKLEALGLTADEAAAIAGF